MSNDVSVTIDVANQSITSSDTSIITVPTQNFEIVTFDNKPCIRATNDSYATFTISPTVKSLSCDVFLQAVDGFTLLIEFDTVLNTKYSLVYYPHGSWWNPDRAVFDSNDVLVGVWVTVAYSSTNKTITFDNGTNQLVRTIDSSIADLSIGNFGSRYNIYLTNLGAETSTRYINKPGLAEVWANIKNYIAAQLLGKSNTGHTHTKSDITDFPAYGNTAGTICEGNDSRLSDARTPTSHTHTKSQITDFPSLATVATSGSYNDLSNKPTIPSKISDLSNDSNFVNSLNNYTSFSWSTPVSGKLNIKIDQTWLGGILTTADITGTSIIASRVNSGTWTISGNTYLYIIHARMANIGGGGFNLESGDVLAVRGSLNGISTSGLRNIWNYAGDTDGYLVALVFASGKQFTVSISGTNSNFWANVYEVILR